MSENARAAAGWLWLLTLITVITLASIAGGKHHPPPAAQQPDPPAWAVVTADGIGDDLAAVLGDLRQADADRREAWVADGYSSDFAALTEAADHADGSPGLNAHARVFSTDGYAYLSDYEEGGLRPGWRGRYAQLRAELNVLAADTGMDPVPAPAGVISAAPGRAGVPVPVTVPAAGACTTTTTSTASSSDSGAHSQSAKTSTKCGTTTTSTTRRHAVSKTGAVTNTTSTSTKTATP